MMKPDLTFLARLAGTVSRTATILGMGLLGAFAVRYILAVRPRIEGIDFYFYVCFARDLAAGAGDVSRAHLAYFPGVYAFWRAALAASGGRLPGLQWAYVGLLLANAALLFALVRRVTGSLRSGGYAALWYVVLFSLYEGFYGCTEPLTTLPALAGLLVWGGEPLRGARGALLTLALGVGLGLALFAKQQGGLISLGAVSLGVLAIAAPAERRPSLSKLLALPAIAAGSFVLACWVVGYGLAEIRGGLRYVDAYESHGSFARNLNAFWHNSPLSAVAICMAALIYAAPLVSRRLRPLLAERSYAVGCFALLAGAASLLQFTKRAYLHYALIPAPMFIAATVIAASMIAGRVPIQVRASPTVRHVALVLAALPLVQGPGWFPDGHLFSLEGVRQVAKPPPWREQSGIAEDLAAIRRLVRPNEDLLILPPRLNEIHFHLGTRATSFPQGYGWSPVDRSAAPAALRSGKLRAVLVLRGARDLDAESLWQQLGCEEAFQALGRSGFREIASLPNMALWRRDS